MFCPDCSRPGRLLEHGVEGCPWQQRWAEVPCQAFDCRKPNRRPDACCSDRCAQVVASYKDAK